MLSHDDLLRLGARVCDVCRGRELERWILPRGDGGLAENDGDDGESTWHLSVQRATHEGWSRLCCTYTQQSEKEKNVG